MFLPIDKKPPLSGTLPLTWRNFLVSLSNAAHQKKFIPQVPTEADLPATCKAPIFPLNFSNVTSWKWFPSSFYCLASSCSHSWKRKYPTLKIQEFHLFEQKPWLPAQHGKYLKKLLLLCEVYGCLSWQPLFKILNTKETKENNDMFKVFSLTKPNNSN